TAVILTIIYNYSNLKMSMGYEYYEYAIQQNHPVINISLENLSRSTGVTGILILTLLIWLAYIGCLVNSYCIYLLWTKYEHHHRYSSRNILLFAIFIINILYFTLVFVFEASYHFLRRWIFSPPLFSVW